MDPLRVFNIYDPISFLGKIQKRPLSFLLTREGVLNYKMDVSMIESLPLVTMCA